MISVVTWLKSFGFTQDPFSSTEAGGEDIYSREFLHATFVKPDCFDDILGNPHYPKSSLIFAKRGSGKSSARVMLAYDCEQGLFPTGFTNNKKIQGRVLPVLHTRFSGFYKLLSSPIELAEAHTTQILRSSVTALIRMLTTYPDLAEKARQMPPHRRVELQSYLMLDPAGLSFDATQRAHQILGNELFRTEKDERQIGFPTMAGAPADRQSPDDWMETWLAARPGMGPIDLLERFCNLIADLNILAVYVLMDGLDENWMTVDQPEIASNFLLPLLADLRLMNTIPGLAFKVFAPTEMAAALLDTSHKVRTDRIGQIEIQWDAERLSQILQKRLTFCSDGAVESLGAASAPEFKDKIDLEIVRRCQGIPRRLILLGRYMIQSRCEQAAPNDPLYLTESDLDQANARLMKELGRQVHQMPASQAEPAVVVRENPQAAPAAPLSADWLRRELPFPLAYAYLIYQRETDPDKQLRELTEWIEATLAYLSLVLIGFLYRKVGADTADRLRQIDLSMVRIPLGRWRAALSGLGQLCARLDSRSSFIRQCQHWTEQQSPFLSRMNEVRNQYAHDGTMSREDCTRQLKNLEPGLQEFQTSLRFLAPLHLVKVTGLVKRESQYVHRCTSYMGDVHIFPTIEITCAEPLDSDALWLVSEDMILKLHPLLIARPTVDGRGEDIWLYHGVNNRNVYYKFYGAGRTQELTAPREQIRHILGV